MEQHGYKKLGVLGRGAYGTVYHCSDAKNNECCVKVIKLVQSPIKKPSWPSSMKKSPSLNTITHLTMISREIYLLKQLKHPRIIQCWNSFQLDDHIFIVMEYAPNGTLNQLLRSRLKDQIYFSQEEILRFFCDIIMALEYIHLRNVIHRDLKPDNILLGRDGRIKIADFGISMVYTKGDIQQLGTCKKGTPFYMAPECLNNNQYSFASDIWALGCIFYELCTLTHPFANIQSLPILHVITSSSIYKSIDVDKMGYHNDFRILAKGMLDADPYKRFTISKIVTVPLIIVQYYGNYFNYGY